MNDEMMRNENFELTNEEMNMVAGGFYVGKFITDLIQDESNEKNARVV